MKSADLRSTLQGGKRHHGRRLRSERNSGGRWFHRATLMSDNRILVAGGYGAASTLQTLVEVFDSIRQVIAIGAPLYNEGKREACYRVYEGAAMRLEREISCPGLRDALGHGLLRASAADTDDYTAKAWAMRDTFDGIIDVIVRKARDP